MKRAPAYRPKCRTCKRSRRSTDLMCTRCWALVPVDIQREVKRAWTRGTIRQTDAWVAAVEKAVAVVEEARKPELGPCRSCGAPYDSCPISRDDAEWTTHTNGNHDGLCCEDCQHLREY